MSSHDHDSLLWTILEHQCQFWESLLARIQATSHCQKLSIHQSMRRRPVRIDPKLEGRVWPRDTLQGDTKAPVMPSLRQAFLKLHSRQSKKTMTIHILSYPGNFFFGLFWPGKDKCNNCMQRPNAKAKQIVCFLCSFLLKECKQTLVYVALSVLWDCQDLVIASRNEQDNPTYSRIRGLLDVVSYDMWYCVHFALCTEVYHGTYRLQLIYRRASTFAIPNSTETFSLWKCNKFVDGYCSWLIAVGHNSQPPKTALHILCRMSRGVRKIEKILGKQTENNNQLTVDGFFPHRNWVPWQQAGGKAGQRTQQGRRGACPPTGLTWWWMVADGRGCLYSYTIGTTLVNSH